jgi:hypothetical protein
MDIGQIGNPSVTYSIVAYPSSLLYESNLTNSPRDAALIVVAISLTSLLVFLYYICIVVEQEKQDHMSLVRSDTETHFSEFLAHEVLLHYILLLTYIGANKAV